MASLVYLTTRSNLKLAGDLARAGHRIFEAQTVSEALYFCEKENVDAVLIEADIEDPDVVVAHLRWITITMKPEATAKELIWELAQLFPGETITVQ